MSVVALAKYDRLRTLVWGWGFACFHSLYEWGSLATLAYEMAVSLCALGYRMYAYHHWKIYFHYFMNLTFFL